MTAASSAPTRTATAHILDFELRHYRPDLHLDEIERSEFDCAVLAESLSRAAALRASGE